MVRWHVVLCADSTAAAPASDGRDSGPDHLSGLGEGQGDPAAGNRFVSLASFSSLIWLFQFSVATVKCIRLLVLWIIFQS
jgi:hypothetical protein